VFSHSDYDESLVRLAQRGEREAFDVLVTKYRGRVMRSVSGFIYNGADAEDAVQEIFIRAYRGLHTFRGDSSFYTWLYRIALNVAKTQRYLNSMRASKFPLFGGSADCVNEASHRFIEITTPESILAATQAEKAVESAINALPSNFRATLILREIDGLDYHDIAKVMGCSVGTIRSRIFRSRELIGKYLMRQ
jgi:RNA polymerase sigma-70 factor (ECF subfamily)